ncbi:PrpF domain-containing protein [Kingella kingae]|uniref:PrpF domain-containing protein n=1 Tax=Kingella kingae TaxID=504 RepID=UPI00254A9115|nr:PrpF domain-containing protein [Kingella kingae]MDK4576618.1 PrpF domain-containing protein [Kingella kingae]MDK4582601.1 PrpF domain-containing protein [Kingella kingae]MDK4592719.1 PrpF domain-containing protein [Kingella kingae]MDK4594830.1 PrpF domain-containing protein [Kingella kingae]MDK4644525.1 PrpF domain-containing protein [Kingella kingae]
MSNDYITVVPFALERGMIQAQGDTTTVRVLTLNTGMLADITVQTPNGEISYDGDAKIDGVPNTSAPIEINFLDTAGSVAGSLLPTGQVLDTFDLGDFGSLDATCIDNGMLMVLVCVADLNRTAYESVADLNADTELKATLERLRLVAAEKMGLGDVRDKNYPKMCLFNKAIDGSAIHTRCFIPHVCHDAVGVVAAVTVATACVMRGTVADGLSNVQAAFDAKSTISVEHPSGEFSVVLTLDSQGMVTSSALLRTARLIMRGEVMILNHVQFR